MADIDVERKTGPGIWPWILGLVLLGLVLWLIASMMGRDDRPTAVVTDTAAVSPQPDPATPAAAALPPAADAFMRDCHVEEGTGTEGPEHEFTVNCLEQLASSLDGLAAQRPEAPNVDEHTRTIRDRAQQIRASPETSQQHANWTREAALAGASALEAMQRTWHVGDARIEGAVAQTRQAAEEISPTTQHLEQLSELRTYLRRAGDAINLIAQQRRA